MNTKGSSVVAWIALFAAIIAVGLAIFVLVRQNVNVEQAVESELSEIRQEAVLEFSVAQARARLLAARARLNAIDQGTTTTTPQDTQQTYQNIQESIAEARQTLEQSFSQAQDITQVQWQTVNQQLQTLEQQLQNRNKEAALRTIQDLDNLLDSVAE